MVAGYEAPRDIQTIQLAEKVSNVFIKHINPIKIIHLAADKVTCDREKIRFFFADDVLNHQHGLIISLHIFTKVQISDLHNSVLIF